MPIILIAEDDESQIDLIRLRLKHNIEANEFSIMHAKNGKDALDILKSNDQIDILISDINMPEMDGLELLNIVKEQYPLLKTIIMSAYGDMDNIRNAMNQGAYDFIIKPFNKIDLVHTIHKALEEVQRFKKVVKALHSAEEENRLKSEFLANVSHELLTPMHGILSFSEIGLGKSNKDNSFNDQLQKKCNDYFGQIQLSAKRLLHLIDDLLKLSMLESGLEKFNIAKNEINNLIKQNISILETKANEKGIKFTFETDEVLKSNFDAVHINETIYRVLENAVKYSPDNSIVSISAKTVENDQGKYHEISVSDQGPGIPNDELKSIFDKFSQSTVTNTGAGGRGLGLALCKEIMKQHQGKIWAENNQIVGSIFYIQIPVRES